MAFDYASILSGIGGAPSTTGKQGYENFRFGTTAVRPAMAVDSPVNTSLGVTPGAVGGAGMAAPAGSNAPPVQNTASGGSGVGGQLADSLKAIGDMIANYNMAGAYGKQEVNAQAPGMVIQPSLANFTVPGIARRY